MTFDVKVEDSPREIIISALIESRGYVTKAAHLIGMPRRTFYRRLDELRLWPAVNELRRQRTSRRRQDAEVTRLVEAAHAV